MNQWYRSSELGALEKFAKENNFIVVVTYNFDTDRDIHRLMKSEADLNRKKNDYQHDAQYEISDDDFYRDVWVEYPEK